MASYLRSRRFITRRRTAVAIGIVLLALIAWRFSAILRGRFTAWQDHARGHYEVQVYGLPPPWCNEYARLLRERHSVEINSVGGCVVDDELANYVDGYNAVSWPRIQERFGKDIFAECAGDAREAWERENKDEK